MSIKIKTEKLLQITKELRLCGLVLKLLKDDFQKRTLARRVLIRTKDFITHSRQIRKPLLNLSLNVSEFHKDKEIYAKEFEEYYQISRDKFSGHLQDIEMIERLDLWNNIEYSKVQYFIDGAYEIYIRSLKSISYDEYVEYSDFNEYNALKEKCEVSTPLNIIDGTPRISQHYLGLADANSVTGINEHILHRRAGQLNTISRWIGSLFKAYVEFGGCENVQQILKAQIITDIVSYADCFITKTYNRDANTLEGLEDLIAESNLNIPNFDEFKNAFKFDSILQEIRSVRNLIGGHLDTSDSNSNSDLLVILNGIDLNMCMDFYYRCYHMFKKISKESVILSIHNIDGEEIHGILPGYDKGRFKQFEDSATKIVFQTRQHSKYTNVEFEKYLNVWFENPNGKNPARTYFFDAFISSDLVEDLNIINQVSQHSRNTLTGKYTVAHEFLQKKLTKTNDLNTSLDISKLISDSASGYPLPLSLVIKKSYPVSFSNVANAHLIYAFGDVVDWKWEFAREFILNNMNEDDFVIRLAAKAACIKTWIHTEGLSLFNNKCSIYSFETIKKDLLDEPDSVLKLYSLLTLLSQFIHQRSVMFFKSVSQAYEVLKLELISLIGELFVDEKIHDDVSILLDQYDFAGVCVILDDCITINKMITPYPIIEGPLSFFCQTSLHWHSQRNRAVCLLRSGNNKIALLIMQNLSSWHPDNVFLQLSYAQFLLLTGNDDESKQLLSKIKLYYNLSVEDEVFYNELIKGY